MSGAEWFAVDVVIDPEAAEAVESAFNSLDCLGTETGTWKTLKGAPIRVSAFFAQSPDLAAIENAIKDELDIYGFAADVIGSISPRPIEQTDWLAEWKKHWRPVEVGRFIIAPPWFAVDDIGKHIIRIEPNMAFGTGTHETTQLCLKAISENLTPARSFLDVGTGTGILAIAAAKLGAAPIAACDTDADSITIARENAGANGVGDKIDLFQGSVDDATPSFDLVCANLTLDVIVPLLPLLIARSNHLLVLSGILTEQESVIQNELLKFQLSHFKFENAGEWISVLIDIVQQRTV
jgi:ribosomal protein L11 methyltransferase